MEEASGQLVMVSQVLMLTASLPRLPHCLACHCKRLLSEMLVEEPTASAHLEQSVKRAPPSTSSARCQRLPAPPHPHLLIPTSSSPPHEPAFVELLLMLTLSFYVCMHVCHTYVSIYVCIHTYVCMHVCMYVCM